ncbi:MAG: hypothetical protein I8H72_00965 [Myxococcaceae bacterium]|nr:hypothetical protein [Myxococcaceae bacterium]
MKAAMIILLQAKNLLQSNADPATHNQVRSASFFPQKRLLYGRIALQPFEICSGTFGIISQSKA